MIIETNPCERCDFTPSICDGDIEICQLTLGNSKPILSSSYENKQVEQYKHQHIKRYKAELQRR